MSFEKYDNTKGTKNTLMLFIGVPAISGLIFAFIDAVKAEEWVQAVVFASFLVFLWFMFIYTIPRYKNGKGECK